MKNWLLALFLLGMVSVTRAQAPTPNEHLKPVLWMVGDWQGIEKGTDGDIKVLLSARLARNSQAVLYHVQFEKAGKISPKYEGMYYWHPGKNFIAMTQINEEGNLGEGTYSPTGANEGDQFVKVMTGKTSFELKAHYTVEKESFRFVGQFRPAGKADWVPAVDVVYKRVTAAD